MAEDCEATLKATSVAPRICAMGGATGAHVDINHVLHRLPADFPIPILVSLPGFGHELAPCFDESSSLSVKLAQAGEKVVPATVYVAHGHWHLGISGDSTILMSDSPPINNYRPSSTYMFESVAKSYAERSVGIIVAGLGRDGVAGVIALHKAGGTVIAANNPTLGIFTTQRAAIEAGAVDCVLPVDEIADYLVELVQSV